jgi:hypothetical protein
MAYPELFPSPPPTGLTGKTFLDALWHSYDTVVSRTWAGARDAAIDNVTGYIDDLAAAGAQVPPQWKDTIRAAQEGAAQFDNAMIGRFGEYVEEAPMVYGTRSTQIRALANRAGIPTATDEGLPLDKKTLAVINKYADLNYKSLEDVPLKVAEESRRKSRRSLSALQKNCKRNYSRVKQGNVYSPRRA